jgi:hypothetical protein
MQIYIPPPSPHPFQCCAYARRRLVSDILFFYNSNIEQGAWGKLSISGVKTFHYLSHSFWQRLYVLSILKVTKVLH